MRQLRLSLVVTARNEEARIGECLRSVAGIVDEVVLVDDASQDNTVAVAQAMIASWNPPVALQVLRRRYDTPARQMNFGLEQARGRWALLLDCDERASAAMRTEVPRRLEEPEAVAGVYFPRQNIVFGRWLRHGGNYPDFNHPRLVRVGRAQFADHPVHPRMRLAGAAVYTAAPLVHHSYASLAAYFGKFNRYTSGEAQAMAAAGRRFTYGRMWLESVGHLGQRGLRRAAFLDGAPGLIYLGLGFIYDLARHLKLRELTRVIEAEP